MVCMAAWVSFDQDKAERLQDEKGKAGLINFLLKNKHLSPFEHGQFTFRVTTPLFVRSEHHRHRTQSYNEVSGRYTQYDMLFYLPPNDRPLVQAGKPGKYMFLEGSDEQYAIMASAQRRVIGLAVEEYHRQLEWGIAKEVARMVLPPSLMTSYYATVNPRNLMAFLDLRTDPTALHEIRQVAGDMEDIFKNTMPLTYTAWKDNR
jgi:thymidylate synthase (FAD)